jgi:hypothetical protein
MVKQREARDGHSLFRLRLRLEMVGGTHSNDFHRVHRVTMVSCRGMQFQTRLESLMLVMGWATVIPPSALFPSFIESLEPDD